MDWMQLVGAMEDKVGAELMLVFVAVFGQSCSGAM